MTLAIHRENKRRETSYSMAAHYYIIFSSFGKERLANASQLHSEFHPSKFSITSNLSHLYYIKIKIKTLRIITGECYLSCPWWNLDHHPCHHTFLKAMKVIHLQSETYIRMGHGSNAYHVACKSCNRQLLL